MVLHARDAAKAEAAGRGFPQVEGVVEGDLETLAGVRAVAEAGQQRSAASTPSSTTQAWANAALIG